MELFWPVILGIVQGITEWLPISSSGHLVILQELFRVDVGLLFDLVLHLGTLLAVIIYFRKEIYNIILSVVRFDFKSDGGRLFLFILIGSVPAGVVGFLFNDFVEKLFSSLFVVGIALIITGIFLFVCERWSKERKLNFFDSVLIGIAQAVAIIPGISRSGSTIGTGMLLGVKKEDAAKFSFLLSIPAILGGNIYEFLKGGAGSFEIAPLLIGFLTAFVFGYLSLGFLMRLIRQKKFHYFSYYCIALGLVVLLFLV